MYSLSGEGTSSNPILIDLTMSSDEEEEEEEEGGEEEEEGGEEPVPRR